MTARGWNVRTPELEQSLGKSSKDKSAPTLWVIALVSSPTTGVLWSWHLGTSKTGERRYLIDLLETLPKQVLSKACSWSATRVTWATTARSVAEAAVLVSDPALFAGTTLQPGDGQGGGIHRGRVLVLDRRCREQEQASVATVRVIRVAAQNANDVWLVTNVLDPKRFQAELAARFYRMRWESECFFRTYKRVVKDVRLVSSTVPMVVPEKSRDFAAGVPALVGARGVGLESGRQAAGRDELKCHAGGSAPGGPPRARRGSQAGAAEQLCQAVATDRTRSPGANQSQDEERTTAAEKACGSPAAAVEGSQCRAKAPDRSFKPQGSGGLSYYATMRYLKSRWNP